MFLSLRNAISKILRISFGKPASTRIIGAYDRLKAGFEFLFILCVGRIPSQTMRRIVYKYILGVVVGKKAVIYAGAEIRSPQNLVIGDFSIIGHGAILDARGGLTIGVNVNLSTGVWIWTEQHLPQDPDFKTKREQVTIKDYAWISSRSVILPGVTVGKGAVVSAGSVVTKNVPDYSIVAGVPAKVIGKRSSNLKYTLGDFIPFV